jgi:hypothetical protein
LPKDGTWATYDVAIGTKLDGRDVHISARWCIASVGTVSEADTPCRWIEFRKDTKIESEFFPHTDHEAWALLFPEKYLAKGLPPMEHILRAWHQLGTTKPERMTKPIQGRSAILLTIFSGPWKDCKELEPVVVSSKLGPLSCEGVQGTLDIILEPGIRAKDTLKNRLHPKSPFGVVAGHWMFDRSGTGKNDPPATVEIRLADFGDNASSQVLTEEQKKRTEHDSIKGDGK